MPKVTQPIVEDPGGLPTSPALNPLLFGVPSAPPGGNSPEDTLPGLTGCMV